ncbi:MAG: TIGR04282 family arsenosugar biosynthesis glycosyltransferase [Acidimicrobiales bacterium]
MPPALMVLVDDPAQGVPGVSTDPTVADALLRATLELARQVPGVGRVLLCHPPEIEGRLAARALGFRLWPQEGSSPGERYRNAFRQSADLGYEGALVIGLNVPTITAAVLSGAATALEQHHGAVAPDLDGGIALLALAEPQPTLFPTDSVPSHAELVTRAGQQRVRLVELPPQVTVSAANLVEFLSSAASA